MARRSYAGAAASTTLNGAINGSVTSLAVTDGSSYPDGSGGKFAIVVDKGLAGEEKILVTSRTGNTFSGLTRGYDGTSASSHANLAVVQHCITAVDIDESNAHVNASAAVHGLTGTVVGTTDAQTLTNKTLTTPSIADFTSATHDHSAANKGGQIPESSVTNLVSDLAAKAADTAVVHTAGGDTITASAAGVVPLTLKHAASPTVDWLKLIDSASVIRFEVTKDGDILVKDSSGTTRATLTSRSTLSTLEVSAAGNVGNIAALSVLQSGTNPALQVLDGSLTRIATIDSAGYFNGAGANRSLHHGQLAKVVSTSLSTSFTNTATDLTGMTATVTPPTGRTVKISFNCRLNTTVANDLIELRILDGANIIRRKQVLMAVVGGPGQLDIDFSCLLTGDGVGHVIKVQGIRTAGTGTENASGAADNPSVLLIEDIGTT